MVDFLKGVVDGLEGGQQLLLDAVGSQQLTRRLTTEVGDGLRLGGLVRFHRVVVFGEFLQTASGEDRSFALLRHEVGMDKPSVLEALLYRWTFGRSTLEDQHQEPGRLLGDLLEQIFEAVAHEADVGAGFRLVSTVERTVGGQEQVRQATDGPDVGLRVGGLTVEHFG